MRRALFAICLLVALPLCTLGQDTPAVEVFGGFSYFRTEGGRNLDGWHASLNRNLNSWFGLAIDMSGHYDSESTFVRTTIPTFPLQSFRFESDSSVHTITVGPRLSYRKHEKVTPFGHLLVGGTPLRNESVTIDEGFSSSSFSFSNTGFTAAVGGGLDVKLTNTFALRLVQADYMLTRMRGSTLNNGRVSVGLVIRFGNN